MFGVIAPSKLAGRLATWLHRRAAAIVLVAALLAGLAGWAASALRIDQELRRLLPDDFPSVVRLEKLSARVGQQSDLFVTIRSPSREANIAFGERIAKALAERDDIRYAVFERDFSFFEDRALLYAPLHELLQLRREVIAKIREGIAEEALADLSVADDRPDEPAAAEASDPLDIDPDEIRRRYGVKEALEPYLEADQGRLMVVKARPTEPSTDLAFATRLGESVRASIAELDPSSFHPQMQVQLDGAYAQHTGRLRTIEDDVRAGGTAAVLALLLTLGLYFRSLRAVALVFVPLLGSVLGALAFAWLVYGVLNLVTAFIFTVLLGLGIDFGIHLLARYRQERCRGLEPVSAWSVTLGTAGFATLAGGASTAASFAALAVADFQGFAQFGIVAAVGIVLALVSAIVVMPALTLWIDRWRPWDPTPTRVGLRISPAMAKAIRGLALGLAGLGLLAAILSARAVPNLEFEHDLAKLGAETSDLPSSEPTYRNAVGKAQTVAPAFALPDDPAQAEAIHRQLEALRQLSPEQVDAFDPERPPALPDIDIASASKPSDGSEEAPEEIDDPFGDDELDDPRFVELERRAVTESIVSAATAAELALYPPDRLATIHERLSDLFSVYSFVPRHQAEKLEVIADIRRRVEQNEHRLTGESRRKVEELSRYLRVRTPIAPADLPAWVRGQFEDREGGLGSFVVVYTRGSKAEIDNARRIYGAYATLLTATGEVEVAADFFVIPEIFDVIERDAPVVFGISMLILCGAVFAFVRRLGAVLAVAFTLGLALLWLGGIAAGLGWKLNIFNVIVLPMLLGMGEDAALHLYERNREEGPGHLGRVLRETGGAITMSTVTTIWGFAGILFANHRGLNSMAWFAVIGIAATLVASIVVLPVLLDLGRRFGQRGSR